MLKLSNILGKVAWLMFWRSPAVWFPTALAVVINITNWLLLLWQLRVKDQTYLALHYSIYVGTTRIAPIYQIYLVPVTGLLFILLNVILSHLLARKYVMLRHILLWSAVILNLVFVWITYALIVFNS